MTEPTTEPTEATTTEQPEPADEETTATEETTREDEAFPREYVEKLRQEAAGHRKRAEDRDNLAAELWNARVAATGRLADPTDLPMPEGADVGADAVTSAVEELLARKPHLASRRIVGDVGQGATHDGSAVDLAGMLRRNAS